MRANGRIAIGVVIAGASLPVAVAWADEQITASPVNRFDNPNVTIDQGERLTFRNNDVRSHDVTSDPDPALFHSELISSGQTSFVEGSQYLVTGSYNFVCSIHSEMKGTLTVTAAGTPVPKPGSGGPPPADTTAPALAISAASSLRRKARKLRVAYTVDEASTLKFVVKRGSRRVGSASTEAVVGAAAKLTIRLSASATRKRGKLTITATARDTANNVGSAKAAVKVR